MGDSIFGKGEDGEVWPGVLIRVRKAWDGLEQGGMVRVAHHPATGGGPDATNEAVGTLVSLLGGSVEVEREVGPSGGVVYVIRKGA